MRKLLSALYITSPDMYLSLDGENIVISREKEEVGRRPIHTIESIVSLSYVGASPALLGKMAELNKSVVFLKPSGKFLYKVTGKAYGNIMLRREQYRMCDDDRCFEVAKNMISAKIANSSAVLSRAVRDHSERIDTEKFKNTIQTLQNNKILAYQCDSPDSLRGIEGESALRYFSLFDDMILKNKEDFFYKERSRRPPMDNVNSLLSFTYSLLTSICVSALETVGLDPYAGFFHTERPERCSLALDLIEELRAPLADRFVLTLINNRVFSGKEFLKKENGSVILTDDSRREFISKWESRKAETITHPILNEKVEWGLLPYVQASLLAKFVRNDIDAYPPFLWK